MLNQEMIFSEERQTWNLFVDGEWYLEGTYEQVEEAMFDNAVCDAEEEDMDYIREGWGEEEYEESDWERDERSIREYEEVCRRDVEEGQ